jgi:hypothetical protein
MQRHVVDPSVSCGFIRGSRTIASFHLPPLLSFATTPPVISSFQSRQDVIMIIDMLFSVCSRTFGTILDVRAAEGGL